MEDIDKYPINLLVLKKTDYIKEIFDNNTNLREDYNSLLKLEEQRLIIDHKSFNNDGLEKLNADINDKRETLKKSLRDSIKIFLSGLLKTSDILNSEIEDLNKIIKQQPYDQLRIMSIKKNASIAENIYNKKIEEYISAVIGFYNPVKLIILRKPSYQGFFNYYYRRLISTLMISILILSSVIAIIFEFFNNKILYLNELDEYIELSNSDTVIINNAENDLNKISAWLKMNLSFPVFVFDLSQTIDKSRYWKLSEKIHSNLNVYNIPPIPDNETIDILIKNPSAKIITVLKKRKTKIENIEKFLELLDILKIKVDFFIFIKK